MIGRRIRRPVASRLSSLFTCRDWLCLAVPGAKNESAPQVAPFYWGIKDVQFEKRQGWTRAMLKRVAKSFKAKAKHFNDS